MFENQTIVDVATPCIPECEDITLRQNAPQAHARPWMAYARPATWVFIGSVSMPHAEHLIPFRI